MDLKKINSLTELFFFQYEKQKDKNKILLSSLKEPRKNYSWQQTFELINNLSDELKKYAKTENLAVVVKAEHHCMTHRGVREHESDMTTAIMLGAFKEDPATRNEFYKICMSMKGHG